MHAMGCIFTSFFHQEDAKKTSSMLEIEGDLLCSAHQSNNLCATGVGPATIKRKTRLRNRRLGQKKKLNSMFVRERSKGSFL
jgi:hypothetical protein